MPYLKRLKRFVMVKYLKHIDMDKENIIDFFKKCRKNYLKLNNDCTKNCDQCPVKSQCDTVKGISPDVNLCVLMTPSYNHVSDMWNNSTNNILAEKTSYESWGDYFIYNFMPCQTVYYAVYTEDDKCIHIESCTLDLTKTSYNDALSKCKKYCENVNNNYCEPFMCFLGFTHPNGVMFGDPGRLPIRSADVYKEIIELEGFEVKNIMPFGWNPKKGSYV